MASPYGMTSCIALYYIGLLEYAQLLEADNHWLESAMYVIVFTFLISEADTTAPLESNQRRSMR